MFSCRVCMLQSFTDAQVKRKAITVPQRAVQQTLGKYFISVIDENGEAKQKEVKVGPQIGKFWLDYGRFTR